MVNPTATILSAKMMLGYLGMERPALSLEKAVQQIYVEGEVRTYDQSGKASTTDFADAVLKKLDEVEKNLISPS
jgi:isocitrate/isopropylmalate dehydrogenase